MLGVHDELVRQRAGGTRARFLKCTDVGLRDRLPSECRSAVRWIAKARRVNTLHGGTAIQRGRPVELFAIVRSKGRRQVAANRSPPVADVRFLHCATLRAEPGLQKTNDRRVIEDLGVDRTTAT